MTRAGTVTSGGAGSAPARAPGFSERLATAPRRQRPRVAGGASAPRVGAAPRAEVLRVCGRRGPAHCPQGPAGPPRPFSISLPRALLLGPRSGLSGGGGARGSGGGDGVAPSLGPAPLRPAPSPPSPPPFAGAGQLQRSGGAGGGPRAVRCGRAECEARRAAAHTDACTGEGRRPLADARPRAGPGTRLLARPCARPAPSCAPAGP